MSEYQGAQDGAPAVDETVDVRKPRPFHVIMHNDNYTSMEFVVMVLEKIFHHTPARATQLMLEVHNNGKAVAGTYTRDIAETKAAQSMALAREQGYPLKCTVRPAK